VPAVFQFLIIQQQLIIQVLFQYSVHLQHKAVVVAVVEITLTQVALAVLVVAHLAEYLI
jgi:hypothetical protein